MLKTIFSSIIEITIVSSIIIAIIAVLYNLLNKRYAAKWRCLIWTVIIIRLLIPINITMPSAPIVVPDPPRHEITVNRSAAPIDSKSYSTQLPNQPIFEQEQIQDSKVEEEISEQTSLPNPQIYKSAKPITVWLDKVKLASYIWILGMLVVIIIQVKRRVSFQSYVKHNGKEITQQRILNLLKQTCNEMELSYSIKPILCKGISSPMVVGLFKPQLLFPMLDYTNTELTAILRHEMMHIKKHHLWFKFSLLLCEIIYWFNPFIYLMSQRANQDIEYSCDCEVLKRTNESYMAEYSKAILSIIENTMKNNFNLNPVLATGFGNNKNKLFGRFQNIFEGKKKKKGIIAVAVIVLVIAIGGLFFVFGNNSPETSKSNNDGFAFLDFNNDANQVNDSLTVYKLDTMDGVYSVKDPYDVDEAVKVYKYKYPNIKVNVVEFKDIKRDEFYKKLASELMVGKGPDVIIGGVDFCEQNDIKKMISGGVFAEMDSYLKKDKSFDIKNYYGPIMKQGVYQDHRYIMPMRFNFPFMISAEGKLKEAGVDIANCQKSYIGLLEEISKYKVKNGGKAEFFGHTKGLYNMLEHMGAYASNDSPDFATNNYKSVMELYKSLYSLDQKENCRDDAGGSSLVRNSKLLFSYTQDYILNTFTLNGVSPIQNFDKPEFFALRKPEGGIDARIEVFGGINNNSVNKQNAYNYIKMLQSNDGVAYYYVLTGLPTDKRLNEIMINAVLDVDYFIDDETGTILSPIPKKYADDFIKIINEIDSAHFYSPTTTEILRQMKPYFEGEKSYDECIKKAKQKMQIYLSE